MIAIIGAGLAGVACARNLTAAGRRVTVFDKSPRIGGRLATRRGTFDHGCQYLSATTPDFQAVLADLTSAGIVCEWRDAPAGLVSQAPGSPRFCAPGGLRRVVEHLARGLTLEPARRVQRLLRTPTGWTLIFDRGEPVDCSWLVLTPPVPQSLELLFQSGIGLPRETLLELRAVEYTRCVAFLAECANAPRPTPPGAVDWLADNHAKGVATQPSTWTVLLSAAASEELWDAAPEQVAATAFGPHAPAGEVHRWRYCRTLNPLPARSVWLQDLNLTLAGDGFGSPGGTAETAYLSGLDAAETLP